MNILPRPEESSSSENRNGQLPPERNTCRAECNIFAVVRVVVVPVNNPSVVGVVIPRTATITPVRTRCRACSLFAEKCRQFKTDFLQKECSGLAAACCRTRSRIQRRVLLCKTRVRHRTHNTIMEA